MLWHCFGLIFVSCIFLPSSVLAGGLRFEHVMTESGVSVAETNAIAQDKQGFIWIGGSNGLARYNGHSFEMFLHNPKDARSLSNNFVWDLLVDAQGRLWVATTNGLNRFVPETQSFERYLNRPDDPSSLISNDVYTLMEDRDGHLWVGTRQGLDRFDPTGQIFQHFKHNPDDPNSLSDNSITALYQDSRGAVWVGTQRGLNLFNDLNQTFSLFRYDDRGDFYAPELSIRALVEDGEHNLWLGTDGGLFRFNQKTGDAERFLNDPADPHSLSDNRVWKLLIDSKASLWVATDHGGLSQYQPGSRTFLRYKHDPYDSSSLASDQVREIFEDSAGDYWVALFPSGVDYANHTASAFTVYHHAPEDSGSISHDAILSIAEGPEEKVWIGTEGGLNLFDPHSGKFTHLRHQQGNKSSLGANAVLAIARDKGGRFWFGTWSGGLNLYLPESGTFKRYMPDPARRDSVSSAYIWSLLGDSKGRLWVGTEAGDLDLYDPVTDTFTHFTPDSKNPKALSGGFMRTVLEDREGTIWIATLQGLNRFNEADQTFTRYQHQQGNPTGIPHNSVATVFEDSRGRLWIGTESGLAQLVDRKNGHFKTYTTDQGLPNDSIMGIREDAQGYLWINTLNGLSRFDPQTERFTNYNRLNGLAGNIMNRPAIYFTGDEMYVGSTKGLTRFRPDQVRDNALIPPMVLTSFRVFNQEVAIEPGSILEKHIQYTDRVVLDYKKSMFSLHFAALSYRNSAANQYAYRMQGFDDQWINAGRNHSATYTNLNPGHYVFTVKGANNNGIWNEEGRSLHITVLPPPWRTWWAYGIYVLIVLGVIYVFVQSQRRKVEFEKQKVAHLRAIDKLKDEFLANTSHELRTPLNGIIGLTESLIDDPQAEMSEKVRTYLKMIAGSGRRLSNLINDILDFSKIKNHGMELRLAPTNFANVCDAVCIMSKPLADKKNVQLIYEIPEDMPPVLADEDRLQQILYNLIGNAIKFTFTGHVKVYADWNDQMVTVYVEDTGIGIPEADLGSIFESFTQARGDAAREFEGTGLGLAVAKNLIELHGGMISVVSQLNKGSTFRFTLRISDEPVAHQQREVDAAVRLNAVVDVYGENESEVVVTESPNVDSCKFHILVVDDDTINRQVLIGQLSLHNYRISEASNGQEAVEKIKSDGSVDLVLLDVMMPRMTGYEAAMQIRAIKPVHELPIIFITAKHLASDLVAGFVAGGNDFLIKPVSKNELLSRTKTHLLLMDVTRNLENIVEERTNTLKEAQKSLETVDNIVNLINQQSTLEGLARILLKESARLLGQDVAGAFWLMNERGNAYNLISIVGDQAASQAFPTSIPAKLITTAEGGCLLKYGVQIFSPDDLQFVAQAKEKIDSVLVMAIEAEGQLAALLVFANRAGAGQFTERERQLFSRLETHAISAVSKARMLEALRRQNQKLEEISYTDQLTLLHNRRHLTKYLQGDLALCKRRYQVAEAQQQYPKDADLLFILVDIDHFKPVNDTYGHNAGDAILKKFAPVMKKIFRESDHLIRWGGEEFLVVVRFFDRRSATALVERFRREVEQTEFDIGGGNKLNITCSVGFSCYPFYQNTPETYTWEQVVEIADQCLYAAKKTRRNAWVGMFGNSEDAVAMSFEQLHKDLPGAVAGGNVQVLSSISPLHELKWNE